MEVSYYLLLIIHFLIINYVSFDIDPTTRHTWFTIIIGSTFTNLTLYAVNQTQIQRLMTVKNLKSAQTALWWNWPILSALSLLTSFSGLVIYYYYRTCDPLSQGRISSRDQNMPIYVVDALGNIPGLSGLFVSGIFSASLSSVSACLNSLAAVTLEDYFKPLYAKIKKKPWGVTSSLLPKMIAGFYGLVCVGIAFLAQFLGGVLQTSLTVFGVVGGPLLGLFTLGMTTKLANQWGAITGLVVGVCISMWIGFGEPKPPPKLLDFSTEDCSQFGGFNKTLSSFYDTKMTPAEDDSKRFVKTFVNIRLNLIFSFLFQLLLFIPNKLLVQRCNWFPDNISSWIPCQLLN